MFTVHGDDLSPIERMCPKAVKRIVLKQGALNGALEFLKVANINARFPDMFGAQGFSHGGEARTAGSSESGCCT
jgi:hypothetical protein